MIDTERTQQNMRLIHNIITFGYPVDILQQMQRWQHRTYTQIRMFV